jgi:hypothetical protein
MTAMTDAVAFRWILDSPVGSPKSTRIRNGDHAAKQQPGFREAVRHPFTPWAKTVGGILMVSYIDDEVVKPKAA